MGSDLADNLFYMAPMALSPVRNISNVTNVTTVVVVCEGCVFMITWFVFFCGQLCLLGFQTKAKAILMLIQPGGGFAVFLGGCLALGVNWLHLYSFWIYGVSGWISRLGTLRWLEPIVQGFVFGGIVTTLAIGFYGLGVPLASGFISFGFVVVCLIDKTVYGRTFTSIQLGGLCIVLGSILYLFYTKVSGGLDEITAPFMGGIAMVVFLALCSVTPFLKAAIISIGSTLKPGEEIHEGIHLLSSGGLIAFPVTLMIVLITNYTGFMGEKSVWMIWAAVTLADFDILLAILYMTLAQGANGFAWYNSIMNCGALVSEIQKVSAQSAAAIVLSVSGVVAFAWTNIIGMLGIIAGSVVYVSGR